MESSEGDTLKLGNSAILSYISVAFLTCVVYDLLLKFNDEVEILGPAFHWPEIRRAMRGSRSEWSWSLFVVRVVYLIGRYAGVALQMYMAISRRFAIVTGFLGTVVLCATQALIALRIYRSLGPFDPKAKKVLVCGFVLEFALLLVIQAIGSVQVVKREGDGLVDMCSANAFPGWLHGIWVPILCLELLMLTLAVRASMVHRELDEVLRTSGIERFYGGSRVDSVPIILRDSLVSLVVLLTICLVNLFGNQLFGEFAPVQTSLALSTVGSILTGSQLLTNLHQARSGQEDEMDLDNGMELRAMFAAPPRDDEADSPQPSRTHSTKDLGLYDPA